MTTTVRSKPRGVAALDPPLRRLLGRTGAAALALFAASVGTFAPDGAPPVDNASAEQIRDFLAQHQRDLQLNAMAACAAVPLAIVFFSSLARLLHSLGAVTRSHVVLIASVLAVLDLTFLTATYSWLGFQDLTAVSGTTLTSWYAVSGISDNLSVITVGPKAMIMVAGSWTLLRARLISRTVCWVSLGLALVWAANLILLPLGTELWLPVHVGLFGWWLWPLALGIAMVVRWRRARPRPPRT